MNRLSKVEYQKLIDILKDYKQDYPMEFEESLKNIVKSIEFDAKVGNKDLSKAKIKLIYTFKGPEIGVTFEE
jgi:hypothetical protein